MDTLFLKLLNMSFAAGFLVIAVILLRLLLKKAPKWIRCVLWALVAVRLLCPFSISSPLSVFAALGTETDGRGSVEYFHYAGGSEKPLVRYETVRIAAPADDQAAVAEIPGGGLILSKHTADRYLPALERVWLTGVAAMLLYALISWLRLRWRVAASLTLRENILLNDSIDSPFILGLFRPRIYLPTSLTEPALSHVLAHERAHIARRDQWWKLLGFMLLAVYWFHPLLWLAYFLLCRDIELACDERVVRDMESAQRADYSQALLDGSRFRPGMTVCPLAFGEIGVKERVKAALNYKKPACYVVALAVVACLITAVCFLTDPLPADATYDVVGDVAGPEDTADDLAGAELSQTVTEASAVAFSDVMGYDGYYVDELVSADHYQRRYYASEQEERALLAESFGFGLDDYVLDLDGDGVTELICNCQYGGDGVQRVYVYRRRGDLIERGSIDPQRLELADWYDWGANSHSELWDGAAFLFSYDTEQGRSDIRLTDLSAFTFEEYAPAPPAPSKPA